METSFSQILITLFVSLTVFLGWYNSVSDPYEKKEKKPYPFWSFLKLTWANGLFFFTSGVVLLLVFNETGFKVLQSYIDNIPDLAEHIGRVSIAVLSGLYGHKFIKKFI
ncbi:hypothetical protein [Abyssalbus ytuae]|uniref:Uncharacterized protein n=1 Tax=Abyssalbus ytuae TaxID=2926907 RepID=A0A9E7CTS4_9FLAO|nr:hypothetical protein [Abyssalbus ytuae]UOB18581.1 hypothetical protein MQE35_04655 [Abyssalbus ytuae]